MPRQGLTPTTVALAAADLADRDGAEAVTLSALARELDVRPASLYGHVDGLDGLRAAVAALALEEMAVVVTDALVGRSGRDAVRALADAYRDYARAHPGRYAASRWPQPHEAALAGAGPRHTALVAGLLRGYAVPEADHPHAVRLLGATVHGFIQLEAAGSYAHSEPPSQESWDRLVERLDAMLTSWA